MGNWSVRMLRDENGDLAIKEVYFDENEAWAFTESPIQLYGFDDKEDAIQELKLTIKCLEQYDILNEDEILAKAELHPLTKELRETIAGIESGDIKTTAIDDIIMKLQRVDE